MDTDPNNDRSCVSRSDRGPLRRGPQGPWTTEKRSLVGGRARHVEQGRVPYLHTHGHLHPTGDLVPQFIRTDGGRRSGRVPGRRTLPPGGRRGGSRHPSPSVVEIERSEDGRGPESAHQINISGREGVYGPRVDSKGREFERARAGLNNE